MKRLRTSVATLRMVASDGIYTAVAYEKMLRGPMRGRETAEGFPTCAREGISYSKGYKNRCASSKVHARVAFILSAREHIYNLVTLRCRYPITAMIRLMRAHHLPGVSESRKWQVRHGILRPK